MRLIKMVICILCILLANTSFAKKSIKHNKVKHVAKHAPAHSVKHVAKRAVKRTPTQTATQVTSKLSTVVSTSELAGFDHYPNNVKKLITNALSLANQHLSYKFGSSDPSDNGMDCSGTISYLLKQSQVIDVPRQADGIYKWTWENGEFFAVNSNRLGSFEFSELKPGDLLFWTGTYPVRRDPAISHVMMYLGKDKQQRPLMFGATTGRTYRGKSQNGVSVFDFNIPSAHSKARFLGYACIPNLTCDFRK